MHEDAICYPAEVMNMHQERPLHLAARTHSYETVKCLAYLASLRGNERESNGISVLCVSCCWLTVAIHRCSIMSCYSPLLRWFFLQEVVALALVHSMINERLRYLLDLGALPHFCNSSKETPLHLLTKNLTHHLSRSAIGVLCAVGAFVTWPC